MESGGWTIDSSPVTTWSEADGDKRKPEKAGNEKGYADLEI
jgi:hypothetical protein